MNAQKKLELVLESLAEDLASRDIAMLPVTALAGLIDGCRLAWSLSEDGDPVDHAVVEGLRSLLYTSPETGMRLLGEWRAVEPGPRRLDELADRFGLEFAAAGQCGSTEEGT